MHLWPSSSKFSGTMAHWPRTHTHTHSMDGWQSKTKQVKDMHGSVRQHVARPYKARQGKARKARQGKAAKQGKASKARQGQTIHGKARQSEASKNSQSNT